MEPAIPTSAVITLVKGLYDRARMRRTLQPSAGSYEVWKRDATTPEPEKVTIAVKRGDLFEIDMDFSAADRGHATATIEINRRTLEGDGMYEHVIAGTEPLVGTWHLRIRDRDTVHVMTKWPRDGIERTYRYVWRKETGE